MDTLRPRCPFLLILGWILGASWDQLWAQVNDLLWFWGGEMGDSFQVHVFCDPGMEMTPQCNACMCYNHRKNKCVLNDFTCSTYSVIWSPGDGIWVTFWCLVVTLGVCCLLFKGPWDRLEIWWFFRGTLGEPGLRVYTPGVVTGWSVAPLNS